MELAAKARRNEHARVHFGEETLLSKRFQTAHVCGGRLKFNVGMHHQRGCGLTKFTKRGTTSGSLGAARFWRAVLLGERAHIPPAPPPRVQKRTGVYFFTRHIFRENCSRRGLRIRKEERLLLDKTRTASHWRRFEGWSGACLAETSKGGAGGTAVATAGSREPQSNVVTGKASS